MPPPCVAHQASMKGLMSSSECRTPGKREAANPPFAPRERELVFDIDLTDYDDVRTCGKEGHICNDCWPLMAVAIKVSGLIVLWPSGCVSRSVLWPFCRVWIDRVVAVDP
eukprot:949359-Pelagomonas_calceolata.AAC.4